MTARTLDPELLHRMDAYWRAANYLSVGQIYLYDNPLLRRPLALSDVRVRASPPHQPRRRDCGATTSPAGAAAPQRVACTRPREAPPAARARRAATAHPASPHDAPGGASSPITSGWTTTAPDPARTRPACSTPALASSPYLGRPEPDDPLLSRTVV